MLQRATTCLESGGRLLRGSKRSFRSHRMLHSSFWHHGASDLDLPACCSSILTALDPPNPDSKTNRKSDTGGVTYHQGTECVFLDFLYPMQTLALMGRISLGYGTWGSGTARLTKCGRTRHFSTKSGGPHTGANDRSRGNSEQEDNQRDKMRDEIVDTENLDGVEQEHDDSDFSPMFIPPSDSANNRGSHEAESFLDIEENIRGTLGDDADALDATPRTEQPIQESFNNGDDALNALISESERHKGARSPKRMELEDVPVDEAEDQVPLLDHSPSQALEKLQKIISGPKGGPFTHAALIRILYDRVLEEDRTPQLIADILDHIHNQGSFSKHFAAYPIQLFDALKVDQRRVSSYKSAIDAHLVLGNLGKAVLVYDQARERFVNDDFCSSNLLARPIQHKRWDIAIEVFKRVKYLATREHRHYLWSRIEQDPRFPEYAGSFLAYMRNVRWLSDDVSTSRHTRATSTFAVAFMGRALRKTAQNLATEEDQARLWRLLLRMKQEGVLQIGHYEATLLDLLRSENLSKLQVMPEITRRLYNTSALAIEKHGARRPNRGVLAHMIVGLSNHQVLTHGTQISIPQVVETWRNFYGELDSNVSTTLMRTYARLGQDSKVVEYFKSYLKVNRGRLRHVAHFRPMIHVHARRADVGNAQKQFDRISTEFKLEPDVECWNILIAAYCRQGDLQGALRLFDEMLNSRAIPDQFSFSPILTSMAQRGDVEGVSRMLGIASEMNDNTLKSTWVFGSLVSALIKTDTMESAELAAEEIWQRHQSGEIHGSMTPILNTLLFAYARKRDIESTRRLYQQMVARGIKPDALTYAAFMQALALVHQTVAAWQVLRTVVPDQNVRELGLHYAICMAGFIIQEEYHLAELVDLRRERRGIPDTFSVRMMREMSKARQGAKDQKLMAPGDFAKRRLPSVDKLLESYLQDEDAGSRIATEPQLGLEGIPLDRADQSYFDILMNVYSEKGSHHIAQTLIDRYSEIHEVDVGNAPEKKPPPLRLIVALMNAHYQAGRYEEVDSCWNMVLQQAKEQAYLSSSTGAAGTEESEPQPSEIAPPRRRILARPLGIYIQALQSQLRHKEMHAVVDSVLRSGYELDNQCWNIYIQNLARSGRILDAYLTCENNLMRDWPGWKRYARRTNRKTVRGWHHLDIPAVTMPPETVLPQYKTMVILAAALQYVRRTDSVGSRNQGQELVSEATLRSRAPAVIMAVETMPYIDDDLQTQFLSSS